MGFLPIIYKLIVTIIAIIPYIFYSHDNKSYQVCATYAPIFSYIISIKSRIINQVQFSLLFLFLFFPFSIEKWQYSHSPKMVFNYIFAIYAKDFFFFFLRKKMHSPIILLKKKCIKQRNKEMHLLIFYIVAKFLKDK